MSDFWAISYNLVQGSYPRKARITRPTILEASHPEPFIQNLNLVSPPDDIE